MRNRRAVTFFVGVIVLYTLFAWPWRAPAEAYSRAFASFATTVLGVEPGGKPEGIYGTNAVVLVYSKYDEDPERDINIVIGNLAARQSPDSITAAPHTSSRHLGFMPAAALAALVLATPISWTRRLWALLWGMLCVHMFVAGRFACILVMFFHGDRPYCLYRWDPPWDRVLAEASNIIAVVPATTYVVPLIIWIGVTFRREDWESILDRFPPADTGANGDAR